MSQWVIDCCDATLWKLSKSIKSMCISKLFKFIQILYVYICFVDGFNQDFCLCLWQITGPVLLKVSAKSQRKSHLNIFESHQSQDSNSAGALKNQSYKDVTKNMQLRPCAPPAETSPLSLDTSRTDRRKQKSQVSTTSYVTGKANLWTRTCCDAGASTSDAGDDGVHLSFLSATYRNYRPTRSSPRCCNHNGRSRCHLADKQIFRSNLFVKSTRTSNAGKSTCSSYPGHWLANPMSCQVTFGLPWLPKRMAWMTFMLLCV